MPAKKDNPRVARTYKLPPDLIKRLEERCAALGIDRTAFVERALEAALGAAGAPRGGQGTVAPRRPAGAVPAPAVDPVLDRAAAFRAAQARRR